MNKSAFALVFVALLWLGASAGDIAAPGPFLNVPLSIRAPDLLVGAAGNGGGIVTVNAYVDGHQIPGSPDMIMEGEENEFEFPITEDMRGKDIRIEAIDLDGYMTVRWVHVY
jgi:hypothetical protein